MNIAGHEAVVIERDDGVIEIEVTRTVFDVVYISYTVPEWADAATRRMEAIEHLSRLVTMPLKQLRDEASRVFGNRH